MSGPAGSEAVWYISRDGQQAGPYSGSQVSQFHADGHIAPTDYLWSPEMTDWTPASAVFSFQPKQPPPPPPRPAAQPRATATTPIRSNEYEPRVESRTEETIFEETGSFKFSTFIFIVLGLIVPIWPITLPLFWYLAYRSYKKPSTRTVRVVTRTDGI